MAGDEDDQLLLDRLNALKPTSIALDRTPLSSNNSVMEGDDIARRFLGLRRREIENVKGDVSVSRLEDDAKDDKFEEIESIESMVKEFRAKEKLALAPGDEKRARVLLEQASIALEEDKDDDEQVKPRRKNTVNPLHDHANSRTREGLTESQDHDGSDSTTTEDEEADALLAEILDEVRLEETVHAEDDHHTMTDLTPVVHASTAFDEHAFPTTPSKEPGPMPRRNSDDLALPSAPTGVPSKPETKPSLRKYTDAEIETWCEICQANAEVRCLGCDGELYCMRCWKEGHTGPDVGYEERSHRCVQFARPGGPEPAAA